MSAAVTTTHTITTKKHIEVSRFIFDITPVCFSFEYFVMAFCTSYVMGTRYLHVGQILIKY